MEDGRELNGHVAYIRGGGLPHGRVLIADGAVRKSEVVAAAKGRKSRPSGSNSYRHLSEENQLLQRANDGLAQQNEHLTQRLEVDHQLILMLFAELGKEPPAELLQRRKLVEPQLQGTSGSSHAASKSIQPEGTPTSTHDDINPAVGVDNSGNDFEADSGSNNGDSDPDSEDLYADSDIDLGSRGCAPGGAGGGASAEASGGASAEASSGARGGAHGGARGGARGGASHDP